VAACVFEKPAARYGGLHIVDYAALFNVTLQDYVGATGDVETRATCGRRRNASWRSLAVM
jgi:hypothetical protein